MMVKRIGELEHILADLIQVNKNMEERLDKHGARLYTLEQLDIPQQVSIVADKKEILHQRMRESDSYKSHEDHMQLFEALEKSMNRDHCEKLAQDLAEARKKKKKIRESPKMPPGSPSHQPPPPPSPAGSAAPSPSKTAALAEYQSWTTTDIRLRPSISLTPADLEMMRIWLLMNKHHRWMMKTSGTGDIATFIDWFYKRRGITELKPQDLEGPAYEIVKVFHPDVIHLQYQMEECHKLLTDSVDNPILRHNVSKLLPLGGPPSQVTIQSEFFFNKDLEYLRYGSKGHRPALSISKMKEVYYPDAGLEQMVLGQFWIEEECKYDIAAMYGISYWWFQRQRFYTDRHTSEGDRNAVRTHIRILSVLRIEVFSMYGYDYMKKIILRCADLNEHVIMERDFKYLYPSDFEDLYLLNLQGHLNHLPPKDKKILTTAVNQWTRQLVIRQHVEDFQLEIESYQTQMMMRFNEIHKFSDGTLLQIDEALDYRVKEFRINRLNPDSFEDTEDLPQLGELCWRTLQRGRL
nr:hypothetical protein [Tanacetum cinerariifolium]